MSLEIAIQENTAAIHALIAALGVTPVEKTAAAEKVETKKPSSSKAATAATTPSGAPETGDAVVEKLTYDQISKPFLELVNKKGRDDAVEVLSQLGVPVGKKLSHLTEDQYANALVVIKKALG